MIRFYFVSFVEFGGVAATGVGALVVAAAGAVLQWGAR